MRALDYRFTAEDEALIDRLVTSGHPSTPGYNDPAVSDRRAAAANGGLKRDLCANASAFVVREKSVPTFPDHALKRDGF